MIRYFKKAIPLSILATGIIATASMADTFTLRVGSGHPSKPTAYVTNMEKVLVPNIKKRVKAETDHKVRIIEAYAGKIAKVHETLEAVEKGLLDIGSYCVCFETAKLLPWNFDYFVPFTTTNLETNWAVKHKILKQFPTLTKMLEDKYNQKFIAMQGFDDYGIGTVKQWQKANELKGVKVIAAGPNLPWVSLLVLFQLHPHFQLCIMTWRLVLRKVLLFFHQLMLEDLSFMSKLLIGKLLVLEQWLKQSQL